MLSSRMYYQWSVLFCLRYSFLRIFHYALRSCMCRCNISQGNSQNGYLLFYYNTSDFLGNTLFFCFHLLEYYIQLWVKKHFNIFDLVDQCMCSFQHCLDDYTGFRFRILIYCLKYAYQFTTTSSLLSDYMSNNYCVFKISRQLLL